MQNYYEMFGALISCNHGLSLPTLLPSLLYLDDERCTAYLFPHVLVVQQLNVLCVLKCVLLHVCLIVGNREMKRGGGEREREMKRGGGERAGTAL